MSNKISIDEYKKLKEEKKSKYNNTKVIIDRIKFDSKGEANRYCELKLLKKRNEIICLECHPKFEIIKKNKEKKIRKSNYIADFKYFDIKTQSWIVEDFKGKKTSTYQLKKYLFLTQYPDYIFREMY